MKVFRRVPLIYRHIVDGNPIVLQQMYATATPVQSVTAKNTKSLSVGISSLIGKIIDFKCLYNVCVFVIYIVLQQVVHSQLG